MDNPVFLLGLHRSGTTLLYELLAASGCFSIVTAWHAIEFEEWFRYGGDPGVSRKNLADHFAQMGQQTRVVDSVKVSPNTPEEYGFLLENAGTGFHLTGRNLPLLERIGERIQSDFGGCRPLLLKNPWDFGRAGIIRKLIPNARFLFIHRNPWHILTSQLRFLAHSVERPDPYLSLLWRRYRSTMDIDVFPRIARWALGAAPGFILRQLVRRMAKDAEGYLKFADSNRQGSFLEVRYEDLCGQADVVVARILARFGLDGKSNSYQQLIKPSHNRIAPEVTQANEFIKARLQRYAQAVGYDLNARHN